MRVRSGRRERTVAVPIQYQSERVISQEVERDFPDDTPSDMVQAWVDEQASLQEAFLDRREVAIKQSYNVTIPPRLSGVPGTPSAEAAKTPPAPPVAPSAPAGPAVLPETRKALREAAAALEDASMCPVQAPVPATEPEAQQLLKELRGAVFDFSRGKQGKTRWGQ